MKNLLLAFYLLLAMFAYTYASDVVIPKVYQTNDQVTAQNLNNNFTALATVINGGLDNDNIDTTSGYRLLEVRSSLPSAGTQGRAIFNTGDNILYIDTGSAWIAIGP